MTASETPDARRKRLAVALDEVARGRRDALRTVYEMTSAKLFGVCLRISQDRELAEDVLQEVYLKIWNRAGRFDPERASPITWLCTIARNAAIDRCRAAPRTLTVPVADAAAIADDRPSALDLIEGEQERARVFDCLDALDDKPRRAIRAAFFDGVTYAQLADQMAVPLGTMKSWVRRGLAQMKACLSDG